MKLRIFSALFALCILPAQAIWINEFHYDNTGTDTGEFIEIAGLAGTDLSGSKLLLYNGGNGANYYTVSLSGVIPNQQSGYGTLAFASVGIQNGAPDGVALVAADLSVLQFLSYEGTFFAAEGEANGMQSTDIGVDEEPAPSVGMSLQLIGTGSHYEDFRWSSPSASSSGSINAGQRFVSVQMPEHGYSAMLFGIQLLALLTARRLSNRAV